MITNKQKTNDTILSASEEFKTTKFKIGDKISHPVYGAGIIKDIETKDLLGEEVDFYIIDFLAENNRIYVSTNKATEIGILKVLEKKDLETILNFLTEPFNVKRSDWMERTRDNEAKLASNDIKQISEVYKELYKLDNEKGLSTTEKRMYALAKRYLSTEIALVYNIPLEEAEEKIIKLVEAGSK